MVWTWQRVYCTKHERVYQPLSGNGPFRNIAFPGSSHYVTVLPPSSGQIFENSSKRRYRSTRLYVKTTCIGILYFKYIQGQVMSCDPVSRDKGLRTEPGFCVLLRARDIP
jgi:hypothetical protein